MASRTLRSVIKHTANRVTRNFASLSRGPFALIRHVGRRSGKPYETPIMVEQMGDSFVIALTYGPDVDWYRNVLAAGHSTLVWHGRVYALDKPAPLSVQTALPVYPRWQQLILRRLGTRQFVRMKYHEMDPAA